MGSTIFLIAKQRQPDERGFSAMHINASVARQIKCQLAQGMSAAEVAAMMAVRIDDVREIATASAVAARQAEFDQALNQARAPKGLVSGYDPFAALDVGERFHK
jgi:hypothetical protein